MYLISAGLVLHTLLVGLKAMILLYDLLTARQFVLIDCHKTGSLGSL